MSRMTKRSTTTGGNEICSRGLGRVAAVVMQVTSEYEWDFRPATFRADNIGHMTESAVEQLSLFPFVGRGQACFQPCWDGRAKDYLRTGRRSFRDHFKIVGLRLIDVFT
ncbi:MAG: hypothetical protein WKF34_06980 [Pyrinomonadaceae bacterium]